MTPTSDVNGLATRPPEMPAETEAGHDGVPARDARPGAGLAGAARACGIALLGPLAP